MLTREVLYLVLIGFLVLSACKQKDDKGEEGSTGLNSMEEKQGTNINDEDLSNFAAAYSVMESKQDMLHQKMTEAIEEKGMSVEKYQEIRSKENQEEIGQSYTDIEIEKFERVSEEIDVIREKANDEIDNELQKYGFDRSRFRQVFQVIEQDPELKRKFQQMMQKQ